MNANWGWIFGFSAQGETKCPCGSWGFFKATTDSITPHEESLKWFAYDFGPGNWERDGGISVKPELPTDPNCADNADFNDEQNYSCAQNEGYPCEKFKAWYGYSLAGQQAVMDECPRACKLCTPQAGFKRKLQTTKPLKRRLADIPTAALTPVATSPFTTLAGTGYCSGSESTNTAARREVVGGTETKSAVETLCTADGRCVAYAFHSLGNYVLYTDTNGTCTHSCTESKWQIEPSLITTTYCPGKADTKPVGEGGRRLTDAVGAWPLCSTTGGTLACNVKPALMIATGPSTDVAGGSAVPLPGLNADPDPNKAQTGFESKMIDLKKSEAFQKVDMTAMKKATGDATDMSWLGPVAGTYFALVIVIVLGLLFFPSGELILPKTAKKIALIMDAGGVLIGFVVMVAVSVAMNSDGVAKDFIGQSGLTAVLVASLVIMPYCLIEAHCVRHFHEDVKSLKCIMLIQGPLLVLTIGIVAVLLLWISAVGDLPAQVASGAGGARWDGHALGGIMGQIEHTACESYRTCCRDPNLVTPGQTSNEQQRSSSATCSSAPQSINTTIRADQGFLVLKDASQPAFCDAISGSTTHAGGGISHAACTALDKELKFDMKLCQKQFCYDAIPTYHAFLTRVVNGIRGTYLTPAMVLLSIFVGCQVLRLFVFRELIQNATQRRAAIDLKDATESFRMVGHEAAYAERELVHDAAVALDKVEDMLHIHHTKHGDAHKRMRSTRHDHDKEKAEARRLDKEQA